MKFTTGIKGLDRILEGGIETGVITHFFGSFGTGKSIFAQQLSITVQMDLNKGGLAGNVIFIDSEGSFSPERLIKISRRFGLGEGSLKRIFYKRVFSFDEQEKFISISEDYIRKFNIKLLIIDCIATHIRSEYNQDLLALRQISLAKHLDKILELCSKFDIASVITNQVLSGPIGEEESFKEKPVGGNIIAKYCKYSIKLSRFKNKRFAQLVDSMEDYSNFVEFEIREDGIHEIINR